MISEFKVGDRVRIESFDKMLGESNMENEVSKLWYERQRDKIIDKYEKLEDEFMNNKYSIVQSYKELIEQFESDLENLFKLDKATEQFVLKVSSDDNTFKYDIDYGKICSEFRLTHLKDKENEINKLNLIKEEVEAQLSLSNDLDYQVEVLTRYGILDKKTKKMVD